MKHKIAIAIRLFVFIFLVGCSVTVGQDPESAPADENSGGDANLNKQIPVTWAGLNLTGRLLYIYFDSSDFTASPSIQSLDLVTGRVSTLFQTDQGGWIYYLSASPDGKKLVISYIPPSDGTSNVSQALYVMPVDGTTAPQLLLSPPTPSDQYVQVEWSPDGKYIYYVHVNQKLPLQPGQLSPVYALFRISYPDGVQETVAENAFWPRLSLDSSSIVYVSNDPFLADNLLYFANADGSDPHEVVLSGSWIPEIKDAPILLPGGQTIIFSAPIPPVAYEPNWLDRLMDVKVVKAHNVPSDWWSISTNGGTPVRLTKMFSVNLFASLSPDKTHIASLSGDGLFVMKLDGTNLTQVLSDTGVYGALSWIP